MMHAPLHAQESLKELAPKTQLSLVAKHKDLVNACEECLAAGKDYCISSDDCVDRGSRGACAAPGDHVTGDADFAQDWAESGFPGEVLEECPSWLNEPLLFNARAMHAMVVGTSDSTERKPRV